MGYYKDCKNFRRRVDLCSLNWEILDEDEDEDEFYKDCNFVFIHPCCGGLDKIIIDIDPLYPEAYSIKLFYKYNKEDVLLFFPIATRILYSVSTPDDDVCDNLITLNKKEKEYFSKLLQAKIGDKHNKEEQKVMIEYHKAVDKEVYNFVKDVLYDREVLPVTVGFFNQEQINIISDCIGNNIKFASRCVIDKDTIRHIIKRHGENGKADRSMSDIEDIARLPYVLSNFDEVSFDGVYSKRFLCADGSKAPHVTLKKRINGNYYIITAVTDAKANKSHIVSAYIS